jgi:hypothetical protein
MATTRPSPDQAADTESLRTGDLRAAHGQPRRSGCIVAHALPHMGCSRRPGSPGRPVRSSARQRGKHPTQRTAVHLRINPHARTPLGSTISIILYHSVRTVHRTQWCRRMLRGGRWRRIGRHCPHFKARELRHRPSRGPERSVQQISPPLVEQATADAMPGRRDRRYARLQALRRNLALLLGRPTSPRFTELDHLDPLTARHRRAIKQSTRVPQ